MGSAGRDYAFGGFLMILATLAMVFLDGSLAVFVAIAAAVSGMVLFVRGAQIEHFNEDPLAVEDYGIPGPRGEGFSSPGSPSLQNYDSGPGSDFAPGLDSSFDWDAHYRREFGEGSGGSGGAGGPGGAGGAGGPGGPGGPDGSTRL